MSSKSKALKKEREGKRYQPTPMPYNYHSMSHKALSEYYKNHKGSMVSNKVNPKTGKYFNTY